MTLRYAEVSRKELRFLDLTSLTVEEFEQIVPVFEEVFHERMKYFRLDGKPRVGREYQTLLDSIVRGDDEIADKLSEAPSDEH